MKVNCEMTFSSTAVLWPQPETYPHWNLKCRNLKPMPLPQTTPPDERPLSLPPAISAAQLSSFSIGAIMNKSSGLKQHACIFLQFRRPDVWNQFHWAPVNMSAAGSVQRLLGTNCPLAFPVSRSHPHSLVLALSYIFKADPLHPKALFVTDPPASLLGRMWFALSPPR